MMHFLFISLSSNSIFYRKNVSPMQIFYTSQRIKWYQIVLFKAKPHWFCKNQVIHILRKLPQKNILNNYILGHLLWLMKWSQKLCYIHCWRDNLPISQYYREQCSKKPPTPFFKWSNILYYLSSRNVSIRIFC